MAPPSSPADGPGPAAYDGVGLVAVSEIREFPRINAELVRRLDAGHARVRLTGAEGQRLLAASLRGDWTAVVEIEGDAGPELAAEMDAPGILLVCHGTAGDGAGRGLRAGRLLVLRSAGDAIGYTQLGGTIVAAGPVGHRAGLGQAGGSLVLLGSGGRLAGERQSGGRLFACQDRLGPHAGHARRGGRAVALTLQNGLALPADGDDQRALDAALAGLESWLPTEPPR